MNKAKAVVSPFDIAAHCWMNIFPLEEISHDFAKIVIKAYRDGRTSTIGCKAALRANCINEMNKWFVDNEFLIEQIKEE